MSVQRVNNGDILASKASMLVCPVNCVGAMGKGLALAFRQRHPDLYYRYKQLCRKRQFYPDTMLVFKPSGVPYRVLALPTKNHWRDPSPPELVERGIQRLGTLGQQNKFSSLALPAVGCGEGGLPFEQVDAWVQQYLGPLEQTVEFYLPH